MKRRDEGDDATLPLARALHIACIEVRHSSAVLVMLQLYEVRLPSLPSRRGERATGKALAATFSSEIFERRRQHALHCGLTPELSTSSRGCCPLHVDSLPVPCFGCSILTTLGSNVNPSSFVCSHWSPPSTGW